MENKFKLGDVVYTGINSNQKTIFGISTSESYLVESQDGFEYDPEGAGENHWKHKGYLIDWDNLIPGNTYEWLEQVYSLLDILIIKMRKEII